MLSVRPGFLEAFHARFTATSSLSGKKSKSHQNVVDGNEIPEISSDCISVDMTTTGGCGAESSVSVVTAGSSRLHPHPRVHRERESSQSGDGGAATQSLLVRNGNELRRSLRRINSITRRKLSPSPSSVATTGVADGGGGKRALSGGGGKKNNSGTEQSDPGCATEFEMMATKAQAV